MTTPNEELELWEARLELNGLAAVWPVDDWEAGQTACVEAIAPVLPVAGWVLDLGCGVGRLAVPIAQQHPRLRVMGVDISPGMVKWANAVQQERVRVYRCDGRTIPVPDPPAPYYVAAWAVDLFDHLDLDVVRGYLESVRAVLQVDAALRFQFSLDAHTEAAIAQACDDAHLAVTAVDRGLVRDNWLWVTAARQS